MNFTCYILASSRFSGSKFSFIVFAMLVLFGPSIAMAQDVPTLSVADVSVFEKNTGTSILTFVITRSSGAGRSNVSYVVTSGTALAGSDFVAVPSSSLQFSNGETTKSVPVTITADTIAEADETLTITLSSPVTATISDGSATGRILNDDLPSLSVADVSISEGNTGTKILNFTVTRSVAVSGGSRVTVATANGSAQAGTDYVAKPPTVLIFSSADLIKPVAVTINGDTASEPNETFTLQLSAPEGATIADGSAIGTIQNDDLSFITVDDVKVQEGDQGNTPMNFTVTRSGNLSGSSSVKYETADDGATAGPDYVGIVPTILNFIPNQQTAIVSVTVKGETLTEPNEKLKLKLSDPLGANLQDDLGSGTIENDDLPTVTIDDVFVVEGNKGNTQMNFTLSVSGNAIGAKVKCETLNDTATAGSDFVAFSETIEFDSAPTKTVTVQVIGDTLAEPNEALKLKLSNPQGILILKNQGTGTIQSDDSSLAVNDRSMNEANIGNPPLTFVFTITRTGGLANEASVVCSTSNGTATAGSDYVALPPTTVTFLPNEPSKTISVSLTSDNVFEPDETFNLNLTSPVGVTISDTLGIGTIRNDDNPPQEATFSINDVTVTEGTGSTGSVAAFVITRSGNLSGTSSVVLSTTNGTAHGSGTGGPGSGPTDYSTVSPITLNFAPNISSHNRPISVFADDFVENIETFDLNLSNASGATIADGSGRATIIDDDEYRFTVNDVSVVEGNSGTKTLTFVVFRLPPGNRGASGVEYTIANGTATAGSDYVVQQPNGLLVFNTDDVSKSIAVTINGDVNGEPDETLTITLSAPQTAVIQDGTATGTITNDDTSLSINDVSIQEGDDGGPSVILNFTVTRTGGLSASSTVTYTTTSGTALVSTDFVGIPPTPLTFSANQTTKTIAVTILPEKTIEANEAFNVNLSNAQGAVITDSVGVGTIVNDD